MSAPKNIQLKTMLTLVDKAKLEECCQFARISQGELVRRLINSAHRDLERARALAKQEAQHDTPPA